MVISREVVTARYVELFDTVILNVRSVYDCERTGFHSDRGHFVSLMERIAEIVELK